MADLGDFIRLWTYPDYPPKQVSESDLRRVETLYGIIFPASYRTSILVLGAPSTSIALLDTIAENDIDLADISEFLTPNEIMDSTDTWREMGLPQNLVAFASDCMGNLFAFDQAGSPEISLFSHDSAEVEQVGASFDAWLARYCELPPGQID